MYTFNASVGTMAMKANAGGVTATKSLELADLCQNQLGLTTCLHLTCTNIRRSVIDDVLNECKRLGIRNILALRGDEPRPGEYVHADFSDQVDADGNGIDGVEGRQPLTTFKYAVDLIKYIRQQHGSYFCIGAAAYPEGHPIPSSSHAGGFYQDPKLDLSHLVEKVEAGAEFILTQLFYDVDKYIAFEEMLQADESKVLETVPIIPGLMPIQGWQSFTRTCKLAKVGLPSSVRGLLEPVKDDDQRVKDAGVDLISEMIEKVKRQRAQGQSRREGSRPHGFHFYTLNLEKAVAKILERCELIPTTDLAVQRSTPQNGITLPQDVGHSDEAVANSPSTSPPRTKKGHRRQSSSHNRVVVARPSVSKIGADFELSQDEAAALRDERESKENALATAEGEGSLGRAATWDDFPNGRWGDSRSPAYALSGNYALHPLVAPSTALPLWSSPMKIADITAIFRRYLQGELPAIPWSEDIGEAGLRPETEMIKDKLIRMNERNWWTVASQPAVNGTSSSDSIVGWGPKGMGLVWQKPFVEFFLSTADWRRLKGNLDANLDEIAYFAGNANGDFEASDEASVHPVTWGAFKGKEIVTPTIIEAVSFRAWQDEAFSIWNEWQKVFVPSSATWHLLDKLVDDLWLVNVIGHDFGSDTIFWELLTTD